MAQLATDSLCGRLAWRAQAYPQSSAFLQKRNGIWQRWTWSMVLERVHAVSQGLRTAGLLEGESVGIASGSRIEAVLSVLACQQAGLLPVLLNPNLAAGGLATLAQQAGISALVAEDQEQVDKYADVQSRLPKVRRCWVLDPKGTRKYTHVGVTEFSSLEEGHPPTIIIAPDSLAVGLFSAGVHQEPRFVPVSHANLLRLQSSGELLGLRSGARSTSLFGLADPIGFFLAVVAPVMFGNVPCFGEGRLPSVMELRQCVPSVVALPARLLDQMRRETSARGARASLLQRNLIKRWVARTDPGGWSGFLIGRPVAASLGLASAQVVMTGYEKMTPISARFLARLGIRALGLYGLVEAGGPVAMFGQAESPALRIFEGYETQVTAEGRLAVQVGEHRIDTGDLVQLHGGEIHLTGREVEMLTMANGEKVSPATIEAELQVSPYINQAVAVGGPTGGITSLIELDEVTLRDWARAHGLSFTTTRSLAESTEVGRLIGQAVSEANQRLPAAMAIDRFILLPRPLEQANGELTPALALRRQLIRNRYAHRIVQGVTS